MKKDIFKILKYVLLGVSIYLAVLLIEICCLYAVMGDNVWAYLKDFWEWYVASLFNYCSTNLKTAQTGLTGLRCQT